MCTTGCRQCTVQNGCHTGLRQSRCMCTTGCFQSVVQNGGHTGLRHILCTSVPNIWKVPWSIFLARFLGSGSGQIVGHKSLEQIFQLHASKKKFPGQIAHLSSATVLYRTLEAPSCSHAPALFSKLYTAHWKHPVVHMYLICRQKKCDIHFLPHI